MLDGSNHFVFKHSQELAWRCHDLYGEVRDDCMH